MPGFEPGAFATRGRRAAVLRYIPKIDGLYFIVILTTSATRGRRAAVLCYIPSPISVRNVAANFKKRYTWIAWMSQFKTNRVYSGARQDKDEDGTGLGPEVIRPCSVAEPRL